MAAPARAMANRQEKTSRGGVCYASRRLKLDFSSLCGFRLGQDEMQHAVLQRRLDPIAVDVFGTREDALVIAVGEVVVNALIPGMLAGGCSAADRQHPSFEVNVHPIG